jgi:hypothetical protein
LKKTGFEEIDIADLVIYKKNWKSKINFDALKVEWPSKICWLNISFLAFQCFSYKSSDLKSKGRNIVMLMPIRKFKEK